MFLLGINAALGQSDISSLTRTAIDLAGGWLNYPRPKTGIERRCKLWPETIKAVQDALDTRPRPSHAADDQLAFLTVHGNRWVRSKLTDGVDGEESTATNIDGISQAFRKILAALQINGHRGFYCLRRGFETTGGDSKDQIAVDHIMGHARDDMASLYRQRHRGCPAHCGD